MKGALFRLICILHPVSTEETDLNELEQFRGKWYPGYPKNHGHNHWTTLCTYFKYIGAVRRHIYTTNAMGRLTA